MSSSASSANSDGVVSFSHRSRPLSAGSTRGCGRRPSSGSRRRAEADPDLHTEKSGEHVYRRQMTTIHKEAPRAIRPSSSTSSRRSTSSIAKGAIGCTPWQPCIEGGSHTSYSEFCRPQTRPELSVPAEKATHGHKVFMSEIQALITSSTLTARQSTSDSGTRQFTLCPNMRSRGFCRLPSCPYVHEVCRPRKQHQPLYNANAEKACGAIPCRFLAVLGHCPYADSCVYSHAAPSASSSSSKPPRVCGRSRDTAGQSCTSSAIDAVFASKLAPVSRSNSVDFDDADKRPHAIFTQSRSLFGGA
mmetsp:Transcript_10416/g.17993  ORF Transcript_10416/g.17993 Transcript_10416/m.17993 type:complete len:303 (+) Transcript_10416:68-976(+)